MKFDVNDKRACQNCHLVPEKVKKIPTEEQLEKQITCKLCKTAVKRKDMKTHKESEQHKQLENILGMLQENIDKLPEFTKKLNVQQLPENEAIITMKPKLKKQKKQLQDILDLLQKDLKT